MKSYLTSITRVSVFLFSVLSLTAHEHRAVGVMGTGTGGEAEGGEPLQFIGPNGTGRIHLLRPRGAGPDLRPEGYHPELRGGGYYYLDERPRRIYDVNGNPGTDNQGQPIIADEGFSLVALSTNSDFSEPGHSHLGTLIWCEILSVTGPAGANFGFWESERSFYQTTPTFNLPVNQPTGSPKFAISEGEDDQESDPYGHIHDRAWTADQPGDYQVTIRFVDLSTNRDGGIPWHQPSQPYIYHFKAGPDFTPTGKFLNGSGFMLEWPSQMGISDSAFPSETGMVFKIMRSTTLAPDGWMVIGEVSGTTNRTVTFTDLSPPTAKAFYKLAYDWSAP